MYAAPAGQVPCEGNERTAERTGIEATRQSGQGRGCLSLRLMMPLYLATCGHMWLHVATHAVVYRSDSWMVHGSSHTCMYVNCSSTDLVFSFQMALGFMNEALPWFTTAVSGPHVAPESRDLCMAVARPTVEHVHTTIIKSSSTNRSP